MSFEIRSDMPKNVAARINIEAKVARRVIESFLKAGYALGVNDGDEITLKSCTDKKLVLAAMFTTDEDYLLIYRNGEKRNFAWVRFIYGNDGWDVVNDYTTNVEAVMAPVNQWTERLSD